MTVAATTRFVMNVLLISPQTPDTFWSFKHVLRFVSKRSTFPPLGLLTVAALLPREWKLKVVDLNVTRLHEEDLRRADLVMISAMLVHEASVREVVARCAYSRLCRGLDNDIRDWRLRRAAELA